MGNDEINYKVELFAILVLYSSTTESISQIPSDCPKTDLIKPCFCENNEILCDQKSVSDLVTYFQTLDKNLNQTEKHFSGFALRNCSLTELKENTFSGITFEEIFIGFCENLTTINVNAFNGTESAVKYLLINYNPKLSSPDNSIFKLLNKFKNAQNIELLNNNITEIPSNAFEPMDHLIELHFGGNSLNKLGTNAFSSLYNLTEIHFEQVNFTSLPDNAFQFTNKSDKPVLLDFSDNPLLTNSIFNEKTLLSINRPVSLRLGTKKPQQMTFLNEKVFLPFLMEKVNNKIDLFGDEFDCNDCRNYWLKKNSKLLAQIEFLKCSNKKQFNDADNFKNCTS